MCSCWHRWALMSPSLQQVLRCTYTHTHTVLLIIVEMLPRQEKRKDESMFYLSSPFPNDLIRRGCNSNHRRAGGLSSVVYSFLSACCRDGETLSQSNGGCVSVSHRKMVWIFWTDCLWLSTAPCSQGWKHLRELALVSFHSSTPHCTRLATGSQAKHYLTMLSPKYLTFKLLPNTVWPRYLQSIS